MIRRLGSAILIIWALGFAWFAVALPGPVPVAGQGRGDAKAAGVRTDAVVVPTGGAGRIERGLEVLRQGGAAKMLVSGVDPEVKPGEFATEFEVPMQTMMCCITLGYAAVDTRGNAAETADWIAERKYRSVRLVTTDWHMRRASSELRQMVPGNVQIIEDGVPSEPSLRILFLEYHKMLASHIARQLGRLWDMT